MGQVGGSARDPEGTPPNRGSLLSSRCHWRISSTDFADDADKEMETHLRHLRIVFPMAEGRAFN
ncbi:MAG: hypothetical protein JWN70_1379 [Planctomycetaceae bacterium]|nr:hypothetical protein [Planctomycetaceae bacterium]